MKFTFRSDCACFVSGSGFVLISKYNEFGPNQKHAYMFDALYTQANIRAMALRELNLAVTIVKLSSFVLISKYNEIGPNQKHAYMFDTVYTQANIRTELCGLNLAVTIVKMSGPVLVLKYNEFGPNQKRAYCLSLLIRGERQCGRVVWAKSSCGDCRAASPSPPSSRSSLSSARSRRMSASIS